MENLLKEFKQLSLWSMVLFISFVTNSCDENNNSTKESVNKTGTSLIKADLTELTNKIGDRDLKLIELIKNNPVSMIKTASYQKTKTSSSEYYFDTDNIMVIKDYNNQAVYIIPAYKSSNARDSNIYSISINITDDFIDTKLNILQIKEDGTQEFISRNYEYSKTNSKTSKTKDIECYCTVTVSDCFCHPGDHADGGCDHPITNIYCGACVGAITSGTSVGTSVGTNSTISTVWASSGGSGYGYVYNYTGDIVYVKLTNIIKQSFADFTFSPLQQFNIKESFEISNILYEFLKTDGVTQNNKDFVVSVFDAIEEGTVTTQEQCLVLLNAYKTVKVALQIENQIDDSLLDPCSKSVFQQVKNTTNCDFANVLAKLGANTIYKTTMVSQVAPSQQPAQTIRTSAYNYKIFISTDYGDKTKLMIACLQLHELAHAYFFSLIDDCYLQNNCQLLSTFPELWEYYVSVCDNQYPSNPLSHHEQIANKYVNAISSALQEFQPGLPQQVYDDLAWSGLEETSVFETKFPQGSYSRQRILNRKAAEQTGHPIAQGTPLEQINYGQPCN